MKRINENERRPYSLVGIDGNAFSVLGYVRRAMKENGYSKEDINAYIQDAMSDDYNHLLVVSVKMVDDINAKNGYDEYTQFEKEVDDRFVDYGQNRHNSERDFIDESVINENRYDDTHDPVEITFDGFTPIKTLMPIKNNQQCLYLSKEDFKTLRIDGEYFINYLEENCGESFEGYICEGGVELIINSRRDFSRLLDAIKRDIHIDRYTIGNYVYDANEFADLVDASYKRQFAPYKRY